MPERVVAIHQPNFMPWLGWFDKLARADVFVLLDSVQFPRTGHGEWMNRVRMLVHGGPHWVTVPVLRRGAQAIREVEIDEAQPWRRKVLRTIETSYARAPHLDETLPLVKELLEVDAGGIAAFNEACIRRLADVLEIRTPLLRASELGVEGKGSDLLADLTLAAGGTVYLSGDGAAEYQDLGSYASRGLELRFQGFVHPVYDQGGARFAPGLSVVDPLMWLGAAGVRGLQFSR